MVNASKRATEDIAKPADSKQKSNIYVNFISWLSLFSPHSSQASFHKALEETEPKAAYGFREAVTLT
jgi:hypothetical protein